MTQTFVGTGIALIMLMILASTLSRSAMRVSAEMLNERRRQSCSSNLDQHGSPHNQR
jgi:hypothetical protein